ncbi:uncharacterized protein DNG_05567 [Cephalotrichum gorgonifer]|uniref:T6SS Phospholipase effector Tle1-like catalytic domain-containing protein n=1 Tax=Cephalotrichum gorgonifer TaxID=2041049 RepID=A0AAE8N043_9PEZI|nr:uncharacterized protein DNG_05567 [Cephalotrichum gorgonifer]
MSSLSKLVVLCDGTWCGQKAKTETNISMLAGLMGIDVGHGKDSREYHGVQARYFDGPGLGNAVLDLMLTGSTSPDVAASCVDIYQYIVNRFTDKHEIWMFGLGRGAYVVRCVAGMISACGVVKKTDDDRETTVLVNHVYSMYEALGRDGGPSPLQMERLRSRSSWDVGAPVAFMGILDTTDPASLPNLFLPMAGRGPPRLHENMNASRAVRKVYHAVSVHETLPLFSLCRFTTSAATEETGVSPSINETWFPGMHYDLGRRKFPSALAADAMSWLLPWLPMARPNTILSDLVLMWMLENIKREDNDTPGTLIPDIDAEIEGVARRLTSGEESKGTGDVYAQMQPLGLAISYLARLLSFPVTGISETMMHAGSWAPWLRSRRILDSNARTYDYKRPFDQSGATVCRLADVSEERYPSTTYDDYQLYRQATGEIDRATYECLAGKESSGPRAPLESDGPTPLTIKWKGPDFHDRHGQDNWEDVLTITKVSHDEECYVARTIPDFLNEFYGDLGSALLDWVTKLCVLKTRVPTAAPPGEPHSETSHPNKPLPDRVAELLVPKAISSTIPAEPQSKTSRLSKSLPYRVTELLVPKAGVTTGEQQLKTSEKKDLSGCLDQVHVHLDAHSITAYFADTSLSMTLPENSGADVRSRLLSALSWVVEVFQTPGRDAEGLFTVGCGVEDGETEGVRVLSSRSELFSPGNEVSSCWTQLFDHHCVAEVPRFHFKADGRQEGLEIDFDLLVGLSRASRPWVTEYGAILFGVDTALIQLKPVESRRWHVVRTPNSFITPADVLEAIQPADQPGAVGGGQDGLADAIKSLTQLQKRQRGEPQSKEFRYTPGNVYVGWCDSPRVSIGAAAPDAEFLEEFDKETGVPAVTNNILDTASVTTVHQAGLAARINFLIASIEWRYGYSRQQERKVQPTAVKHAFNHFRLQIRSARKTPVILWDDSIRRAWLLPAHSVLFFVTVCLVNLLDLNFAEPLRYITASDDPSKSAWDCLITNQGKKLLGLGGSPTDITFGDFVLAVWDGMEKAQSVCYSNTNQRKHVKKGVVFGYDLHDLTGPGLIGLRYLDCNRASTNLRGWEPLARKESVHVIFCNSVGSVIKCADNRCAGTPCGSHCQHLDRTRGVLSCLLPDLKRFFDRDWKDYTTSGILPVTTGFEWVPTASTSGDIFEHRGQSIPVGGGACECCAEVGRLQAVVEHHEPFFLKRLWHKSRPFQSPLWLERSYGVRFGSRSR